MSFSRSFFASRSRIVLLLGILLTLVFLLVTITPPGPVSAFERTGYDEMVRLLSADLPPPDVVVVDIDERSLSELGQWPWPRFRVAAMIDEAAALGARSIALDFLFPEPDRLSLDHVSELYRRERDLNVNLESIPEDARDNDRTLAEAVRRHNVVLGASLQFENHTDGGVAPCGTSLNLIQRTLPETSGPLPVPRATGILCPLPELADAARLIGATNTLPDPDGKQRRLPLVLGAGDAWVPGLALAAVLAATDDDQVTLLWSNAGILELSFGDTTIQTDSQGNLLLPYRGRPVDRFDHISAVDLLEGRVEPSQLQGKIVFVGATASGLEDSHATPVMRLCPGVDLHALAADALLRNDFFVEPGWGKAVQVLTVIAAGILVTLLVAWSSLVLSTTVTFVTAGILAVVPWYALSRFGVYWSPLPGLYMLLGGSAILTLVRLRYEEKRKELLKQSFERYVSAQIVDQIVKSTRPVKVSGERKRVTILMSDIRGFTSMSEKMEPEDLVGFLNSYFAAMIDIILENEGTLDKFMGDAVLALFGAPVAHADDPLRAVRVAVHMQKTLQDLNARWLDEGQPNIRIGIGISTGEVVVGNIGSARRLEYTAIGQSVNYAQRIESLTKELKSDILINESTYEQVKDHVQVNKHGPLKIRGKEEEVYLYEVTGFSE